MGLLEKVLELEITYKHVFPPMLPYYDSQVLKDAREMEKLGIRQLERTRDFDRNYVELWITGLVRISLIIVFWDLYIK